MMILDFPTQEFSEWRETIGGGSSSGGASVSVSSEVRLPSGATKFPRLIADKICVPAIYSRVERPRLRQHLEKCLEQTGATLVTGRAGTGKTALAAEFAQKSKRAAAWFTIEAADADWQVFSKYLAGCICELCPDRKAELLGSVGETSETDRVARATEEIAACLTQFAAKKPLLVVLDDVHHVFDADWFEEFFQSFIFSLTDNVQLLMLSRSEPPLPIWRMRSKQFLSVVDEDLLTFTLDEAIALFKSFGVSPQAALAAHRESYGRAAKLTQIAEAFAGKNI